MVTPEQMRVFAADCFRWADETDNQSHRDLMVQIAKTWMATASTLERHTASGADALPDMRGKLD